MWYTFEDLRRKMKRKVEMGHL